MTLVTFNESPLFKHNHSKFRLSSGSASAGRTRLLGERFLRILIFVMLGASLAGARDIAVVSNKSNAVSAIAIPDLIKLCKAQTAHWPDGKPVTFVMRLQ